MASVAATILNRGKGGDLQPDVERPELHLSGEVLESAFQAVTFGAETLGGIERYVQALSLKSAMFKDILGDGKAASLNLDGLMTLSTFMSSVRRRVAPYLDTAGVELFRKGVDMLLTGMRDTSNTDRRIADFCRLFPEDRKHAFIRDFATEVLHNMDPERYPLMARWVWDAGTNTGALREAWFGDNVDHMVIPVPDTYAAFIVLREELTTFLSAQGLYRDMLYHADLLTAQIYSHYICAQGGSYLRTDFSSPQDPMQYTRRLLGLDGVSGKTGRTRLKSIDGTAFVMEDMQLLG